MSAPALANELVLLRQMIEGDTLAFRKIYEFYRGRIFAFAYVHAKSKDMAEEAVQEVFIRLWEKRDQIKTDQSLENYIKVSVRNQVVNLLKKASLDQSLQNKIRASIEALRNDPPDLLLEKELARLHQLAIQSLSPQQQQVYRLSREEELTYDEIAARLGISRNTVKSHMKEAIKTLRTRIGGHTDLACLILAMILLEKK
jgi:RNA polymerase sigma-70 factor (ECF subfamily)